MAKHGIDADITKPIDLNKTLKEEKTTENTQQPVVQATEQVVGDPLGLDELNLEENTIDSTNQLTDEQKVAGSQEQQAVTNEEQVVASTETPVEQEPKKLIHGKYLNEEAADAGYKELERKFHENQNSMKQLKQENQNQQYLLNNTQQTAPQVQKETVPVPVIDIDDDAELTGKDVKKILGSHAENIRSTLNKDLNEKMIEMILAYDQNNKTESQFLTETQKFRSELYSELDLTEGVPEHDALINDKLEAYKQFRNNPAGLEERHLVDLFKLRDPDIRKTIIANPGKTQMQNKVRATVSANAKKANNGQGAINASSSIGDTTSKVSASEAKFQDDFGISSGTEQ